MLIVADVNDDAVKMIVERFGAVAVHPNEIHAQDVDVFAPCAMGATINDTTLPEIKARAICGVANNQLAEPKHGKALQKRGIAYVPDYVVNAGGMMGASTVIFSTPSPEASRKSILGLYDTILSILEESARNDLPPSQVADQMALSRINSAKQ